jgi:hypothetical protein
VRSYASVTAGTPSDETRTVVCEQRCGTPDGRGGVRVPLTVPADGRLTVVMVFWAVPLDPKDPQTPVPAYDFSSYGFVSPTTPIPSR